MDDAHTSQYWRRSRITPLLLGIVLGAPCLAWSAAFEFHFSDLHPDQPNVTCPKFRGGTGSADLSRAGSLPTEVESAVSEMRSMHSELQRQEAQTDRGSPDYPMLQEQLRMLSDTLKQFDQAGAQAAAPVATPIAFHTLDYPSALAALKARVAGSLSPTAWKSYQTNSKLTDPGYVRLAATTALARGNRLAAAAALLRALEVNPDDVALMSNLAGLVATMGAPNEAIALLERAERLGTTGSMPFGIDQKALLQNSRGYALMAVGKMPDAEAALRQATRLDGQLAEAGRNLAAALGEQDKCEEALRVLRRSIQRASEKDAAKTPMPAVSPTPVPQGALAGLPAVAAPDNLHMKPARQVLDFSRGRKNPNWPYFVVNVEPEEQVKLDRLIADYDGFLAQNAIRDPDREFNQPILRAFRRAQAYQKPPLGGNLSGRWVHYLMDQVSGTYDPVLVAAWQAWLVKATNTYADGERVAAATRERAAASGKQQYEQQRNVCSKVSDSEKARYCHDKAEYDRDALICQAVKDWNRVWRGDTTYLEKSARAFDDVHSVYYTTLTSYLSDPVLRKAPESIYRVERRHMALGPVAAAISGHLRTLDSLKDTCVRVSKNPPTAPPEPLAADAESEMPGCKSQSSLKAKVLIVELTANCEKVGVEVGIEIPILDLGIFVSVEQSDSQRAEQLKISPKDRYLEKSLGLNPKKLLRFEDLQNRNDHHSRITVFGGGKLELGAAGNNVEGKGGFYFSADNHGNFVDVGAKVETSSTVGAELDVGVGELGVGVEFAGPEASVSFVPDNGLGD